MTIDVIQTTTAARDLGRTTATAPDEAIARKTAEIANRGSDGMYVMILPAVCQGTFPHTRLGVRLRFAVVACDPLRRRSSVTQS